MASVRLAFACISALEILITLRTEDRIDDVQGNTSTYTPPITATIDAAESTSVVEAVQEGIDHFFEGMPTFMNALDAVAILHPFIGVAVMAFKTVYTLEMKRRDNENKIIALYVEMKDMMAVLLQLQDVRDEKLIAPDKRSIEDRMKALIQQTADDIKECSNACDTFSKKKLLAKIFQGPMWDNKFLDYVSTFSKRRSQFEFALTIHTSQNMDAATAKLCTVESTTKDINAKMDFMTSLFQSLVSNEQKIVTDMIQAKGGVKVVRNNDKLLTELNAQASKSMITGDGHRLGSSNGLEELKEDLLDDPDTATQKNMVVFSRKFEVQKRQIVEELSLVVTRESDRIIHEVRGGPHERILDRDIHEIWSEMGSTLSSRYGWRGNVKARYLVLALRDYYVEKLNGEAKDVRGLSKSIGSDASDAWAIRFISLARLQRILEAIDDDASGFVTVAEMNRFTSARPLGWSLPHWVAFWAVGWKSSIIAYAQKIASIFAKMEGIRDVILTANRGAAEFYLGEVWSAVHTLTVTIKDEAPGPFQEKFTTYVESEEARLKANLEAVDYIIDGKDTLSLITGGGRPEKTTFPVLYLLVKHHYDIMKAARKVIISIKDIEDGVESIFCIVSTIGDRVADLRNIFLQQRLDPDIQFKSFACGILKYRHKSTDLWTPEYVHNLDIDVIPYNNATEDEVKPEKILKHEYRDTLTLDDRVYDGEAIDREPDSANVETPLKDIVGHWSGYYLELDGRRQQIGGESMFTVVIEPADGDGNLKGVGWSGRGRSTVTGSYITTSESENATEIKFVMNFGGSTFRKTYFEGRYDPNHAAIDGKWGIAADSSERLGKMMLKKIGPRYFAFYPDLVALASNRARSLWTFAINSICMDIRRQRWSWSYFEERRNDRNDFINLFFRWFDYGVPLSSDEHKRLKDAAQRITPEDACFYYSRLLQIRSATVIHPNADCDHCGGRIGGPRITCLDCVIKSSKLFDSLDLCDNAECIASRVTLKERDDLVAPHEPDHHLLKGRTVLLVQQYGRTIREGRAALKKIEGMCKKLAEQPTKTPGLGEPRLVVSNLASELPSCGVCKNPLTLPCWYCVKCEDDLYICNACDAKGVPTLTRTTSKPHNESHSLVRCQKPVDAAEEPSMEQRMKSLEVQFDDFTHRMSCIEALLQRLVESKGVGLVIPSSQEESQ
ncbi:hypothetical protein BV25DRAFT_1805982 [Artomyces pyxidatus]|uniref:Uncharacterized protein n=1 Tax=Artomyces pyxidatus TaxID=48021 RepID=A0ACB8SXI3_9AGAM|nr:hypothetical protein BV25DRAFT_1805982 [Artomyces pyxidatus]